MKILLIDDMRTKSYIASTYGIDVTEVAKTYQEGIKQLEIGGPWDALLLDHDLSSYDDNGKELTGTDIMNFLEQNPDLLPKKIICVSANPVGKRRIEEIINKIYGDKS
jgi:CheY-like chemotaxis protein